MNLHQNQKEMKYALKGLKNIKKKIAGKKIFLFLDYDGTLTPIVDSPDKAVLSKETKKSLIKLVRNPKFKIAIISGRSLKDIKKKVGIPGIIYSGNHGLEIEGPTIKYENNISVEYLTILNEIRPILRDSLSHFKGVINEDKKMTLSIHYRLAEKKIIPQIKTVIQQNISYYLRGKKINIREGKMVLEITPNVEWDKGRAVLWILNHPGISENNFYPLYFGDDLTDEDAFRALKSYGITILVGKKKKSNAQYFLNDVLEVDKFLEQLIQKKK